MNSLGRMQMDGDRATPKHCAGLAIRVLGRSGIIVLCSSRDRSTTPGLNQSLGSSSAKLYDVLLSNKECVGEAMPPLTSVERHFSRCPKRMWCDIANHVTIGG